MGVIVLRNGVVFDQCNNFIVRELTGLMAAEMPDDPEAKAELELAEIYTALMLHTMEPALAERLEKVMLRVAHAAVDGRLPLRSPDLQHPQNREMFLRSMRKLLKLMMTPIDGGQGRG
jgi:hypothetical protein